MAKIFISYARKYEKFARQLATALSDAGADVWIDVEDIPAGMKWSTAIHQGLDICELMLVIITPESMASVNVEDEWQYYLDKKKPIIPILFRPANNIHFQLIRHQYVDFLDQDFDTAFSQLRRELKRNKINLNHQSESSKTQTTSPSPKPVSSTTTKAIDIETLIDRFDEAEEQENWTLAKSLLAQIRECEDYPSWFMIDEFEQDVDEQIARRDVDKAYQRILKRADRDSPKRILRMLEALWHDHQFYDPENFVVENFAPDVSKILPAPFEWCEIPAGEVTIDYGGRDSRRVKTYQLDRFFMAKYPITNLQYQTFVDASDGYQNPSWWDFSDDAKAWRNKNLKAGESKFRGDDLPRERVTWYETMAFCSWLSQRTGTTITLPTEMQWQRAAQGDAGFDYPYGNTFDKSRCNTEESDIGKTTSVTQYPKGASPYGVMDMSGNVFEWTLSQWDNDSLDISGEGSRVLRGGSWFDDRHDSRSSSRSWINPFDGGYFDGFRVVCAVSI